MRNGTNRNKGFTAVEIAMVATVIAILALLILPVFRQRAEEARKVAAADELSSIVKAVLLIEADMPGGNFLPQLSDFDNRSNPELTVATSAAADLEPPRIRWQSGDEITPGRFIEVTQDEWLNSIVPNWQGPYLAFRKSVSLEEVRDRFPRMTSLQQGPILIPAGYTAAELASDRYPVDPWGSPYLLFGADETIYNIRAAYSLGPDGRPSNAQTIPVLQPSHYSRRGGALGNPNTDDLEFLF